MQFRMVIPFAETGIVAVFAVVKVKVGRLAPSPRPSIRMPPTSKFRAVALAMLSTCPGRMMMRSP